MHYHLALYTFSPQEIIIQKFVLNWSTKVTAHCPIPEEFNKSKQLIFAFINTSL